MKGLLDKSLSHGLLDDGTQSPFYGIIGLPIQVKDNKAEEAFLVSRISEDSILGMSFLTAQRCSIDFTRPILLLDARFLLSDVQVTCKVMIPPRIETTLPCLVTTRKFCPLGLVEGCAESLPVATSLNQPKSNGQMVARCMNPIEQPLILRAGSTIGRPDTGPSIGI